MTVGFELQDKVVVITGAAGGLGREFALGFAAEGAKIVAADVSEAGLAETVAMVQANGGEAVAVRVDVTQKASTDALADSAIAHFGRIDVLVNLSLIHI